MEKKDIVVLRTLLIVTVLFVLPLSTWAQNSGVLIGKRPQADTSGKYLDSFYNHFNGTNRFVITGMAKETVDSAYVVDFDYYYGLNIRRVKDTFFLEGLSGIIDKNVCQLVLALHTRKRIYYMDLRLCLLSTAPIDIDVFPGKKLENKYHGIFSYSIRYPMPASGNFCVSEPSYSTLGIYLRLKQQK